MSSDSSCVGETTDLVRTPEISDFWGRLKPQVFSLIPYKLDAIHNGLDAIGLGEQEDKKTVKQVLGGVDKPTL